MKRSRKNLLNLQALLGLSWGFLAPSVVLWATRWVVIGVMEVDPWIWGSRPRAELVEKTEGQRATEDYKVTKDCWVEKETLRSS